MDSLAAKKFLSLFFLGVFIFFSKPAFCQGSRVAVFPFKNNGQAQLSGLSWGLASMFTTDLSSAKGIDIVDPQMVEASLGRVRLAGGAPTTEDALKAAAALGADYAVMGEFIGFGSRFRLDVRLYEVKTGALKLVDKAQGREDAAFEMVDELSGRLVVAITGAAPVVGGSLQVTSEPSGATLRVDGERVGVTPKTIAKIAPGRHTVEIDLDGYQRFTQAVTVRENEAAKVEAKLVRLFGGIRVWWRDLAASDVNISGEKVIPMSMFQGVNMLGKYCTNLPSGHYVVSVRLPYKNESAWENQRTWKTYSADMDLQPGEVMNIYIDNDLFSPAVDVSPCGQCVPNWDFTAKYSWFE